MLVVHAGINKMGRLSWTLGIPMIERLCFIAKIEEGLRQSDAGQLVSHEEVKKHFLS